MSPIALPLASGSSSSTSTAGSSSHPDPAPSGLNYPHKSTSSSSSKRQLSPSGQGMRANTGGGFGSNGNGHGNGNMRSPNSSALGLRTVKHSHFLDLSETEGIRTPRPVTLTPSPPMRGIPLPVDTVVNGHDNGMSIGGPSGSSGGHAGPNASAVRDIREGDNEGQNLHRARSTRSVLGRGRGRVEPAEEGEAARMLRTIDFAARKHACQRRKDLDQTPYINHPVAVANFLSSTGILDVRVLQAAVLHDTVEDTHTTIEEIADHFGIEVARIVEECTDDNSLSGQARKRAQVESAGGKSREAQQVKLADKLHNLESIRRCPPIGWTVRRVQAYFIWAKEVTDICASAHPPLAERLQRLYETAYTEIDGQYFPCHPECCEPLTEEEKTRIDHRLQCLKKGEKPSPLPIFF